MTKWHLRSHRAPTGGKIIKSRKKRRNERGFLFVETQIGKRRIKSDKVFGGNKKIRLFSIDVANISHKGETKKAKIVSVQTNTANPHYKRRNIITKGCIIKTDIGLAKVTSRPGQHGVINGVLIEKKS